MKLCFSILLFLLWGSNIQAEEHEMENIKSVYNPEMKIIGIQCRTSNDKGAASNDIPQLWQRFYGEDVLRNIPNKISEEVIALYCDYEGDYTKSYTCVIGCKVSCLDEIPFGMGGKVIPESTFAVFEAKGEFPKSVLDTWGEIWQSDLPRSYLGDYEVYGEKFSTNKEVDLLIAITGPR